MTYAIVNLKITNPDSWAEYAKHGADALKRHGGSVVAKSNATEILDGAPSLPDLCVILSFPDKAAARGWIDDPDLAHIHEFRRGAGRSDILLLG